VTRGGRWIAAVVVLLVGNAAAMITLAATAGDPTSRVIPDYYQKAVRYDDVAAARAASAALGWTARISLEDGALVAVLTDRDGAPVTGAAVEVEVRPRVRADELVTVALVEVAPGRYQAPLPAGRRGLHDLALTARRDDAAFLAAAVIEP